MLILSLVTGWLAIDFLLKGKIIGIILDTRLKEQLTLLRKDFYENDDFSVFAINFSASLIIF